MYDNQRYVDLSLIRKTSLMTQFQVFCSYFSYICNLTGLMLWVKDEGGV